jgi:hypothetical protein
MKFDIHSSALKMVAAGSSEMLVSTYKATRCEIREYHDLNSLLIVLFKSDKFTQII